MATNYGDPVQYGLAVYDVVGAKEKVIVADAAAFDKFLLYAVKCPGGDRDFTYDSDTRTYTDNTTDQVYKVFSSLQPALVAAGKLAAGAYVFSAEPVAKKVVPTKMYEWQAVYRRNGYAADSPYDVPDTYYRATFDAPPDATREQLIEAGAKAYGEQKNIYLGPDSFSVYRIVEKDTGSVVVGPFSGGTRKPVAPPAPPRTFEAKLDNAAAPIATFTASGGTDAIAAAADAAITEYLEDHPGTDLADGTPFHVLIVGDPTFYYTPPKATYVFVGGFGDATFTASKFASLDTLKKAGAIAYRKMAAADSLIADRKMAAVDSIPARHCQYTITRKDDPTVRHTFKWES